MNKKNILTACFLLVMQSLYVSAQDTVYWGDSRYMFNDRIQMTTRSALTLPEQWMAFNCEKHCHAAPPQGYGQLLSYYTKDTVTVYGVAIARDSMDCDTMELTGFQATLGICTGGSMIIVDSAMASNGINVNRFCYSLVGNGVLYEQYVPLYEYYFEQPHVICDSFYVGFFRPYIYGLHSAPQYYACLYSTNGDSVNTSITVRDPRMEHPEICNYTPFSPGHKPGWFPILQPCAPTQIRMVGEDEWIKTLAWIGDVHDSFQLSIAEYTQPADTGTIYNLSDTTYTIMDGPRDILYAARVRVKCTSNEAKCPANGRWSPWSEPVYYFFGPDMPDTTHNILDDTTANGLREVKPSQRELLLSPNPTTDNVTVSCGLELRHIEVHNTSGILVYDEYYRLVDKATIDFKGLPAGQYVITVETIAGTASKVLTVTR